MSIITILSGIEKGFTPIPRPLPRGAHNRIYEYLDARTKRMYPVICREFNAFKTLDSLADRMEKFIRENYEILGEASGKIDIKRFLFSPYGIAGSGEDHTEGCHRPLSAALANFLSEFGFTDFFVEGSQKGLEIWKRDKAYLFAHFTPTVAAAVKTWDLDITEDQQAVKKLQDSALLVCRKITFIQKLFRLYCDQETWSLQHFNEFLIDGGAPESVQGFWEVFFPQVWVSFFRNIPSGAVTVMASNPQTKELVAEILKIAAIFLMRNCVEKDLPFDGRTGKFSQERNKRLLSLTLGILHKGRKGVFIAGSAHIELLDRLYQQHWPKSPHLYLIPLKTLSPEGVSRSVKTLLVGDAQDTSVHPSKNVKKVSKKIPESALNLDGQIKRLLAFNVLSLDCEMNHFGLWNERANQLLDLQEKTSTEKVRKRLGQR